MELRALRGSARNHTPGAKAPTFGAGPERPKAKALGYLDAKDACDFARRKLGFFCE